MFLLLESELPEYVSGNFILKDLYSKEVDHFNGYQNNYHPLQVNAITVLQDIPEQFQILFYNGQSF